MVDSAATRQGDDEGKRRPLGESVADEITRIILAGEIRPGEKVPEVEIARRLGVSRGPVREACRQLREAGLLSGEAFRGCFVRTFAQREVEEIYVLRSLLETAAVAKAAELGSIAELKQVEAAVEAFETAVLANSRQRSIEADVAFHTAICAAARNERVTTTFAKLAVELQLLQIMIPPAPENLKAAAIDHRALFKALVDRRPDRAVSKMVEHLQEERDTILQYLNPHGGATPRSSAAWSMGQPDSGEPKLAGRIRLRAHEPRDFPLLGRMNRQSLDDQGHRNAMTAEQLEERFALFAEQCWSIDLFVLEDEVIGYALHRYEADPLEPSGQRIHLRGYYIVKDRRLTDAPRLAFQALVKERYRPGERIYLEAIENNPGGKLFWARNGFTPFSTIMEYLIDDAG